MNIEHKFKWVVRRRAWYIRVYAYAWSFHSFVDDKRIGVDVEAVDFCKLWWAFLFLPLAFLVYKPICHALDAVALLHLRQVRRRAALAPASGPSVPVTAPEKEGPSSVDRFFERVGAAFVRVSLAVQSGWLLVRKPVTYVLLTLAVIAGAALSVVLLILAASNLDVVLRAVEYLAIAAGVVTLMAGVGLGLGRLGFWTWARRTLIRGGRETKKTTKKGALGFFGAMRVAYVAVKSSTCPQVTLVDDET